MEIGVDLKLLGSSPTISLVNFQFFVGFFGLNPDFPCLEQNIVGIALEASN